jgi:hypothetical protein
MVTSFLFFREIFAMFHRLRQRQIHLSIQFSHYAAALACCLMLSGCQWLQSGPTEEIRQPPLIPEPEVTQASPEAPIADQTAFVGVYADLSELNDAHPKLKDAVTQALRSGILKPTSPQERFEPNRSLSYGEFRQWAIAYQSALSGTGMMQVENDPKSKTPVKELATFSKTPGQELNPMSPLKLMVLPSGITWENHSLSEGRPLTRQELCALYVFLSHQDTKARSLTTEQIESANPGIGHEMGADPNADINANINMDEALSQFKDYAGISRWARRYVALSYRDGMLQKTFRLTPNQLTVDTGFSPTREITRTEALLLLHSLYGNALSGKTPMKMTQPNPKTNPSASAMSEQPAPSTGKNPTKTATDTPAPLGHLQSIQESGPSGSRSAIRASGPE